MGFALLFEKLLQCSYIMGRYANYVAKYPAGSPS